MADGLFGGGGAAFGIYPQMGGRRTMQDPQASADIPADVLRGRFAGLLGAIPDFLNLKRSLLPAEAVQALESYGKIAPEVPYGSEYYLQNLPLAPTSQVGQLAGQIGSFIPLNPMPVVKGVQTVGRMMGERMAENVVTGRPNLPSMFAEPRSSLFAVEPNPSMAVDESSAVRQQLTGKMQALLAQKKVATSAVEVGAINQQIGELQAQFKSLPAVGRVAREVVAPEITAPVSDLGFYSAAEQAAMNLERSKGTGQSFLNDLMNAPDVKKDELSWIGLDDFLKDKPNVTKQEVQDFIASNKIDLQEVRLGGNEQPSQDLLNWMSARNISPPRNPEGWQELSQKLESYAQQHQKAQGAPEASQRYFTLSEEAGRISEGLDAGGSSSGTTKYQKYQLAGGENYREILLKLPEQNITERTWKVLKADGTPTTGFFTSEEAALKDASYINGTVVEAPPVNYVTGYRSSHWSGDMNVLAHIRVNDRIDADGKKMLLIEEIQSDWHQAGRERGYKKPEAEKSLEIESKAIADERKKLVAELSEQEAKNGFVSIEGQQRWDKFKEKEAAYKQKSKDFSNQVPDAPFKDTWYQLSLKRILKYAADNGYERVGLTTGKRQVERFSDELRQNVDQIDFSSGYPNQNTTTITATKNGQSTFEGNVVDGKFIDGSARGKTIDEVLGKSIAQKIQSHDPSQGLGTIKGDDLTIGGEGMKKYYDEIYPKFLEKYGKKWDASVGETKLNVKRDPALKDMTSRPIGIVKSDYGWSLKLKDGSNYGAFSTKESALKELPEFQKRFDGNREPIRYIDITPKMKEGVKKGQPLAAAEQTPEMLASGGLDYADPFKNPLLESTIG